MAKKKKKIKSDNVGLPIDWHVSDDIVTRFATNMIIQKIEDEFKISFFEIKPPIDLIPPKEPHKSIMADCVSSAIVPASKIQSFIDVMQRQLDLHKNEKGKSF